MNLYDYRAVVLNVIDGNTVDLSIDLGFNISTKIEATLCGISAPSIHGESKLKGLSSRHALIDMVMGSSLLVRTYKTPVAGDIDVYIWLLSDAYRKTINDRMVELGYALRLNDINSRP